MRIKEFNLLACFDGLPRAEHGIDRQDRNRQPAGAENCCAGLLRETTAHLSHATGDMGQTGKVAVSDNQEMPVCDR
jgi:hypothetical protein